MNNSDCLQVAEKYLELVVTATRCRSKHITVALQKVLLTVCEAPVLRSAQLTGVLEVVRYENMTENHACRLANYVMNVSWSALSALSS